MKQLFTILYICTAFICQANHLFTSANDSSITFIGRGIRHQSAITFAYSGSQIRFQYLGNKLKMAFADQGDGSPEHTNYLYINVNGKDSILKLQPNKNRYDLSPLLSRDTNQVLIHKNTEAAVGAVVFHGIQHDVTGRILKSKVPERKILWIGDSYTTAYGNLLNIEPPPTGNPNTGFHSKNQNNYLSWSSISDRKLDAISHQICYSGEGVYRDFSGDTTKNIPNFYKKVIPRSEHSNEITKNDFQPDVIIINLGTNDFGPEMKNHNDLCDSSLFTDAYLSFIDTLRSLHGSCPIILVTNSGITDYWPSGLKRKTRLSSYLKSITMRRKQLYHFELTTQQPPYGEDWHPSVATQKQMGKEITEFLQSTMNWN